MRPGAFALILMMTGAGLLAACEQAEAPLPVNRTNSEEPVACQKTADVLADQWIGKPFEALKPELEPDALPGVEKLRGYAKGSALTMDYVPGRLNVEYDEDGRVTRIHCG